MTIEEIKLAKIELETAIRNLCTEFHQKSGVVVMKLEVAHYDYRPMSMHISDGLRVASVQAKVELGI